jgi:hypothetical protein
VTFLVEAQRQQLSDCLWEKAWDILFFAGHSETEGQKRRIYLNSQESLTVEELKYALKRAIAPRNRFSLPWHSSPHHSASLVTGRRFV